MDGFPSGPRANSTARPCRAFPILARAAPKAVILRRGPSDWVQLILWHTDSDKLEYGQWFKGRIYERRCDLSPNGRLFVYFARKKERRTMDDESYTYAWTAVSRPPYFTALALWPKGNSWNGGGVFDDNTTLLLNHDAGRLAPHEAHRPDGLTVVSGFKEKGEDFPIYQDLLRQNGWRLVQRGKSGGDLSYLEVQTFARAWIWRKRHRRLPITLSMKLTGYNKHRHGDDWLLEYTIKDRRTRASTTLKDATWADWDQAGRLVFVAKGLLLAQSVQPRMAAPQVLADLNPQAPKTVTAPAWAQQW